MRARAHVDVEGEVCRNVGLDWVDRGKRGLSMQVCVWTVGRLKMCVSALMKVCFANVLTPLGPSACPALKTRVMETRRGDEFSPVEAAAIGNFGEFVVASELHVSVTFASKDWVHLEN